MNERGDLEAIVLGVAVPATSEWRAEWLDRRIGLVRLSTREDTEIALVEGAGTEWVVTLHGRRFPVTVQTRRERILAEADAAGRGPAGPVEIKATLPGLVVAVRVGEGSEVEEGQSLITIEAMKMQNEVRAPRPGRVTGISVKPGETVRSGQALLRVE